MAQTTRINGYSPYLLTYLHTYLQYNRFYTISQNSRYYGKHVWRLSSVLKWSMWARVYLQHTLNIAQTPTKPHSGDSNTDSVLPLYWWCSETRLMHYNWSFEALKLPSWFKTPMKHRKSHVTPILVSSNTNIDQPLLMAIRNPV